MVNSREVKLFEKEFLDLKDNANDKNNFTVDFAVENRQSPTKNDNPRLSTSNSIFFSSLKNSTEKFYELDLDSEIEVGGVGILNLKIKKDLNLELIFKKNLDFENISINIEVLENVKLNLVDFTNSKNLYKSIEIISHKNSGLKNSQFILNSKVSHTIVNLNESSTYDLKSVYFGDDCKNYILNKAIHLENNSKSNLMINGVAKNNSKIINDANVLIKKNAKKSISHQVMKNLILDDLTQIQSEPILEVENNDIVCSHASSISQISNEVLYYINSRGISKEDAIKLISSSYFELVIENISQELLKEKYTNYYENFNF